MKHVTIKALFISAVAAFSMNVQAADTTYDLCIADGEAVIAMAISDGGTAAREIEQVTTVEACKAELAAIEAKYADKSVGLNPSSVMTPEDRLAWSTLFDAIDAKRFTGVRYSMASYYR